MATEEIKYEPKDYKSDQYVRWCPGCGEWQKSVSHRTTWRSSQVSAALLAFLII